MRHMLINRVALPLVDQFDHDLFSDQHLWTFQELFHLDFAGFCQFG